MGWLGLYAVFLNGTGRKRPDSETVGHWGVNLSSLMRTWLT